MRTVFLIAGPCVVENEEIVMEIGEKVSTLCKNLGSLMFLRRVTEKQIVRVQIHSQALEMILEWN